MHMALRSCSWVILRHITKPWRLQPSEHQAVQHQGTPVKTQERCQIYAIIQNKIVQQRSHRENLDVSPPTSIYPNYMTSIYHNAKSTEFVNKDYSIYDKKHLCFGFPQANWYMIQNSFPAVITYNCKSTGLSVVFCSPVRARLLYGKIVDCCRFH